MERSIGLRPPAAPAAVQVAAFQYDPETDSWTWTAEMFRLHGLRGGRVTPRRSILLDHAHHEDRALVAQALHTTAWDREPAAAAYRLTDTAFHARHVVMTTEPDSETRYGVRGQIVDVTTHLDLEVARRAEVIVRRATAARENIEQAKRAVMLAYGVDEDTAYGVLRWHAENLTDGLRDACERTLGAVTDGVTLPQQNHPTPSS